MSVSIKNLYLEAVKLDPSAIITLFEIDTSSVTGLSSTPFRFHNNFKIFKTSIFFGTKDNLPIEYFALPIQAEGFELSTRGASPTPKLSMTSSIEGLSSNYFSELKDIVRKYEDLAGAKVTRIKTFVKYINRENFYADNDLLSPNFPPPEGFAPDPNAFFTPEIYFIDRKSMETKGFLEFELGSLFDSQGIKLPGRIVLQKNCTWRYRGEGCGYEEFSRRGGTVLKDEPASSFPSHAPPVANDKDEILSYIAETTDVRHLEWDHSKTYSIGSVVYIIVKKVNYYFVSVAASTNKPPPNDEYWNQDQCSKSLAGCKLRWGVGSPLVNKDDSFNPQKGQLPFGGFPGVARL